MPMTPPPRWTLSGPLLAVAVAAANLGLFRQIVRTAEGHRADAWALASLMMAVNAGLCLILGLAARLRPRGLALMFTVAALTETILWQRALARRDTSWVVPAAVAGGLLLVALFAPIWRPARRG
jgi:uncharacterized membrane protein YphA (DoxX/SURF4 family)